MKKTGKVLVVDDDAVVGQSITRVLEGEGCTVRAAASGPEALAACEQQDFDLVFADIRMPGMDGLEVTERLKRSRPGVPVVIITGFGSEANERRARELGVSAFVHKPLTPAAIVENAELALRERRETSEAIRRSALAMVAPRPAPAAGPEARRESVARNLALFVAAPFIGLAYIVAFPFIGFWAIGRTVVRRAAGR